MWIRAGTILGNDPGKEFLGTISSASVTVFGFRLQAAASFLDDAVGGAAH